MLKFRLRPRRHLAITATLLLTGAAVAAGFTTPAQSDSGSGPGTHREPIQMQPFSDESGTFASFSRTGRVDLTNPFFQPLGNNGRTCQTCHQPAAGWTITPVGPGRL